MDQHGIVVDTGADISSHAPFHKCFRTNVEAAQQLVWGQSLCHTNTKRFSVIRLWVNCSLDNAIALDAPARRSVPVAEQLTSLDLTPIS